jgi:hypothetical protein
MRNGKDALQAIKTLCLPACIFASLLLADPAGAQTLEAPQKGTVRGLAIGIDRYRNVRPLLGAVADAEDLGLSLRAAGATDVTVIKNSDASRQSLIAAFDSLVARTTKDDLIVLSIAGHGASEPERVAGSKPDGRDEVYILAGFDTQLPGSRERIFDDEFKTVIRRIEDKGADILFIADVCHAGGMTRSIDNRSADMSFRQVPAYALVEDDLTPISTTSDAVAQLSDFKRLTFIAAVDEKTTSPEVKIPGIPTKRGALSYAVARAFQGAADADSDHSVTRRELYQYVRQSVYQLSDQRQNVFTEDPPGTDIDRSRVFGFSGAAPPVAPPEAGDAKTPVLVAAIGGDKNAIMAEISPAATPFTAVAPDKAEVIYDPAKREAVAGGDVVASGITAADMPFVIDRMAAVATLKTLSHRRPQTIRIMPGDDRRVAGESVVAQVSGLQGRNLLLFDITGDGTVQFLYPSDAEAGDILKDDFTLDLAVVPPFGTDTLVAVSASRPMPDLIAFLKRNDRQRTAARVADHLKSSLPDDARLGFAVLYTTPGDNL